MEPTQTQDITSQGTDAAKQEEMEFRRLSAETAIAQGVAIDALRAAVLAILEETRDTPSIGQRVVERLNDVYERIARDSNVPAALDMLLAERESILCAAGRSAPSAHN